MPRPPKTSLSELTGEAILSAIFESLRPRLLAMIHRRIGSKLATRIDAEGVIQEAYLRARSRWEGMTPKPADLDAWVFGQVYDRLVEMIRGALGPQRDVDRDIPWPQDSQVSLAQALADSHTGPKTALSRAERAAILHAALARLEPIDREILSFRYFDNLSFTQIGLILNLTPNAATKRCLRALFHLRSLIPPAFRLDQGDEP